MQIYDTRQYSSTLTARHQHSQRVGDFLIELVVAIVAAIDLMIYLAILDKQYTARFACRRRRVRYHQNRLARTVDRREQAQQFVGRTGIQRPGWLVCQNDMRIGNQCPRDCGPLLLTSRYLIRKLFQQVFEACSQKTGQNTKKGRQIDYNLV